MRDGFDRRTLLRRAGCLALASFAAKPATAFAQTRPKLTNYPFTLGVASGDPSSDGAVLWTRLAPVPLEPGGGMPNEAASVDWRIASDERMLRVVQSGAAFAAPERAHSVHVEARGLEPGRPYWYQFVAAGEASPIGRFKTTPLVGAPMDRFRFAFASCQHYEQGYFAAYRDVAEDDLDLVLHLGDYIYESSWGEQVRRHEAPGEPISLDEYRIRHALYKLDPDLQAAHAAAPWAVTWDDHEVQNDYAADKAEDFSSPEIFLKRRAAAYQAYYEHMPLRRSARPSGADMRLHQRLAFGDLVRLFVLDTRQYRSDQPCQTATQGGGRIAVDCAERFDIARTMLGEEQEKWLFQGIRSPAKWNVLGQQLLMAPILESPTRKGFWTDGWEAYPAARRRMLERLRDARTPNPISLGGDIHSFWANEIRIDAENQAQDPIASEFVVSSITSAGPPYALLAAALPDNPHITYMDSRVRGLARVEVTPKLWRTEFRVVNDVRDPQSPIRTEAAFVIEDGRARVQKA